MIATVRPRIEMLFNGHSILDRNPDTVTRSSARPQHNELVDELGDDS